MHGTVIHTVPANSLLPSVQMAETRPSHARHQFAAVLLLTMLLPKAVPRYCPAFCSPMSSMPFPKNPRANTLTTQMLMNREITSAMADSMLKYASASFLRAGWAVLTFLQQKPGKRSGGDRAGGLGVLHAVP